MITNYSQEMRANRVACPICGFWHTSMSCPPQVSFMAEQIIEFRTRAERAESELLQAREQIAALRPKYSDIPCFECGNNVVEFSVPDELWNAVMRPDGHETGKEYLCFDCWNKNLMAYIAALTKQLAEANKLWSIPDNIIAIAIDATRECVVGSKFTEHEYFLARRYFYEIQIARRDGTSPRKATGGTA